jgi:hypothetical protein
MNAFSTELKSIAATESEVINYNVRKKKHGPLTSEPRLSAI